jgi:hypothetical protein
MKATKTTQELGLEYLYKHRKGSVEELLNNLDFKTIEEFRQVGFLIFGEPNESWKATDRAIDCYKSFYKKPNLFQSLRGLYCHYVLKF